MVEIPETCQSAAETFVPQRSCRIGIMLHDRQKIVWIEAFRDDDTLARPSQRIHNLSSHLQARERRHERRTLNC